MASMAELFAEEEERLLEQARLEIAAADEVWRSLTPAQQVQIIEARAAFYDRMFDDSDVDLDEEEE